MLLSEPYIGSGYYETFLMLQQLRYVITLRWPALTSNIGQVTVSANCKVWKFDVIARIVVWIVELKCM